jgi:WD40 repeat protein
MNEKATERFTSEQTEVLQAISRVQNREAHVLTQHPDLLWQQMYNRLQWEGEGITQILSGALDAHQSVGGKPWLKINHPYRESQALIRTFKGHADEVSSCAFSPDGNILATSSGDKTIRLWDLSSGKEKAVLTGHTSEVYHCTFSPAGGLLASAGGFDPLIRLWDAHTGQPKGVLTGHEGGVITCAFSPVGQIIASGSLDGTVRLWDVDSGLEVLKLTNLGEVRSLAFSPDGRLVASINNGEKRVRVWFANTGRQKAIFSSHTAYYTSCIFSPDGSTLAVTNEVGSVEFWDIRSKAVKMTLTGHEESVSTCSFTPDGRTLVTGGSDKTARLWDAATGEVQAVCRGHAGYVSGCACSPDGHMIASCGHDQTVKLWLADIEQGEESISGHTDEISDFVFSPRSTIALSLSADDTFRLWDYRMGKEILKLDNLIVTNKSIDFAFNGQLLACVSADRIIRVWDVYGKSLVYEFPTYYYDMPAFSPDGLVLAAVNWHENVIYLWNTLNETEEVVCKGHASTIFSCHYSQDGDTIATSSADGTVRIWDAETGKTLIILEGHTQGVIDCCFSPEEGTLASVSEDFEIRIWSLSSGDLAMRMSCLKDSIISLAFSPDGDHLALIGEERVQIWDAHTGVLAAELSRPTWVSWVGVNAFGSEEVKSCNFSPDGKLLAYASEDKLLEIWDLHENYPVAHVPCLGNIRACRFSPNDEVLAIGDDGGNVYFLELIGFDGEYGRPTPDHEESLSEPIENRLEISALEMDYVAFIKSKDFENALDIVDRILDNEPENPKFLVNRIHLLVHLERFEEALDGIEDCFQKKVVHQFEEYELHFLRGMAIAGNQKFGPQRYEAAIEYFKTALNYEQTSQAWLQHGMAHANMGRPELALESYMKARALQITTEKNQVDLAIGFTYLQLENASMAELEFRNTLADGNKDPLAYFGLGLALVLSGEGRKSLQWFKSFLQHAGPEHQDYVAQAKLIVDKLSE